MSFCRLTARQREIAARLAAGWSNQDIAADLDLSPGTVRSHIFLAMCRAGLDTRAAVGMYALVSGQVEQETVVALLLRRYPHLREVQP